MTETTHLIAPADESASELRTFMIADVRGYTRFTQERGDEAGATLAMRFAALARESAAARGGEVLELRGDEAFAVFPSARQALRAGIELLERCAEAGRADPEFPLPVGVGLDAGEAVRVEGGFRGGAINLAARLCSLAGPGEVLASEGVIHLARRTEGLRYVERGLVELKGFADPVRVIHVLAGTHAPGEPLITPLPPGAIQKEARFPIGGFLGSLPSGELVGREEELIRLLPSVDAVEEGSGQFVLLAGERGVGKTRLAQEITLKVRDRGFIVATGRCYEQERAVPFFPFLEALAMAYMAAPFAVRSGAARNWPQLARLLPDHMDSSHDPTASPVQEDQQRLFRAVTGFLMALAEDRPVALMLDDLQWADEGSLRLLQHVARTTRGSRLLIVGTYRDVDIPRDSALDRMIRDATRERLVDRLILRRLPPEGTAAFIASMIGDMEASEEFAEYVHRRTKGNPFFIEEILRALAGRYRLVREIGAGGMGRVFQAVDTRTGEAVAAKIMFATRDVDLDALLRFQQEGAVLSTLHHPNIVRVHSTFLEEHASVIIMELLDGQPLDKALGSGPPDLARIKGLLKQVTSALAYAHGKSIVHRDIKPDNIMVLPEDRVKVTDFGIARVVREGTSTSTMLGTGMTLGTPLYSAPEQIEGRKVDGRADIYSLGALLYQVVTGLPPFQGEDALTVAYKHVNQAPTPPTEIDTAIPDDWEALILRALAKNPTDRFSSAAALEAAVVSLSTERAANRPAPSPRRVEEKATLSPPPSTEDFGSPPGAPPSPPTAMSPRSAPPPTTPSDIPDAAAILRRVGEELRETLPPWIHEQIQDKISNKVGPKRGHVTASVAPPAERVREATVHVVSSRARKTVPALSTGLLIALLIAAGLWVYKSHSKSSSAFEFGQPVVGWGTQVLAAKPFSYPDGAATDAQQNVYVADSLNNRIVKLARTGALLDEWGTHGSDRGQFDSPGGIAVDPRGNVIVADTTNGRIETFSPTGAWLGAWGTKGSGPGQFTSPAAVAADAAGDLYVADTGNNRIVKRSKVGTVQTWTATTGRPLDAPAGLALDGAGNVYVANSGTVTSNIVKLSPAGKVLKIFGRPGIEPGRFNQPMGVTIDAQGNLYVAEKRNDRVQKLSPTGRVLKVWGGITTSSSPFTAPVAMASDAHGNIYAVDAGSSQLDKLSSGLFVPWGKPAQAPHHLAEPESVAVSATGRVYVTDTGNNRLLMYSGDRDAPHALGTGGTGPGEFAFPTGVTVDRKGHVYVAEESNRRVQEFSQYGVPLPHRSSIGSGKLDTPHDVAVDSQGALYVADAGTNSVTKLTSDDLAVSGWGSNPADPFNFPQGVVVDRHDNIYVADELNNRIVELSPSGGVVAKWKTPTRGEKPFLSPNGVAVDIQGIIYVADTGNNRIVKFDPRGARYAEYGSAGAGPGQFNKPTGIAVDPQGAVYVADSGNNRVQKFSSTAAP